MDPDSWIRSSESVSGETGGPICTLYTVSWMLISHPAIRNIKLMIKKGQVMRGSAVDGRLTARRGRTDPIIHPQEWTPGNNQLGFPLIIKNKNKNISTKCKFVNIANDDIYFSFRSLQMHFRQALQWFLFGINLTNLYSICI